MPASEKHILWQVHYLTFQNALHNQPLASCEVFLEQKSSHFTCIFNFRREQLQLDVGENPQII